MRKIKWFKMRGDETSEIISACTVGGAYKNYGLQVGLEGDDLMCYECEEVPEIEDIRPNKVGEFFMDVPELLRRGLYKTGWWDYECPSCNGHISESHPMRYDKRTDKVYCDGCEHTI